MLANARLSQMKFLRRLRHTLRAINSFEYPQVIQIDAINKIQIDSPAAIIRLLLTEMQLNSSSIKNAWRI